ncbi:hypothetical protein [Paenibacillus kribbensis]|nr:hypothetical protein [Paenibacillus kribbensis]
MSEENNEYIESNLKLPREWNDALRAFKEIESHRPNPEQGDGEAMND